MVSGYEYIQLTTDLKYPPEIESIDKKDLYFKFLCKYWKI